MTKKIILSVAAHANDAKSGAELGTTYAEAFRFQTLELPDVFPQ